MYRQCCQVTNRQCVSALNFYIIGYRHMHMAETRKLVLSDTLPATE